MTQETYCWPSSLGDVHFWLDEKMDEERSRYQFANMFTLLGRRAAGATLVSWKNVVTQLEAASMVVLANQAWTFDSYRQA